ncbi:MAG: hypothetical protein GKR89_28415 [Candidatus Latescibacteria bacterium]|nr:hypothetical protein [Candidatus Latescibacterota bacterium]
MRFPLFILLLTTAASLAQESFFVEAPNSDDEAFGFVPKGTLVESKGQINALVIFAQFADEADKGQGLPSYANDLFNPDIPNSFAHYYQAMSFGQLTVNATILPRRYTSAQSAAAYLAPTNDTKGRYSNFVEDILAQVDAEYELGQFNNDGPDGVANSADDDRRVDYVFVLMRSVPARFLVGRATGIAGLGAKYRSQDLNGKNKKLSVSGLHYHGTIFKAGNFRQTAGVMVHEFVHSMGLPDLYDHDYTDPEEDSAGVGRWCVMGRDGTGGWEYGGPSTPSAWVRQELGWLGPDNSQLVKITADANDLDLADVQQGGKVYKIALPTYTLDDELQEEYLLLEYRAPQASFYNRNQPGAGLLVWHVRPSVKNNDYEEFKKVDLICADGLYQDAGYPTGQQAAPLRGRDNLDFWAHDPDYNQAHRGNSGDATDLFDGVNFSRLDLDTNPSVALVEAADPGQNGLSIVLHRRGGRLSLDIDLPGRPPAPTDQVTGAGDESNAPTPTRSEPPVSPDPGLQTGAAAAAAAYTQGTTATPAPPQQPQSDGASSEVNMPTPAAEESNTATAVVEFDRDAFAAQEPERFALLPNYPNPFGPETTIPYQLGEACPVRVDIYNSLGQRVRTLVDQFQQAGPQETGWDGRDDSGQDVAAGVYLCRVAAEARFEQGRQMLRLPGYAQLSAIDSTLRDQGLSWNRLHPYLKGPDTRLGYTRQLSPQRAAFAAGLAWTRLQSARLGADTNAVADYSQTLIDLLPPFNPSPEQLQKTRALLAWLPTAGPPVASDATFSQAHWALDHIIGAHSDEAAMLFFAGKWLGRLRLAALAAQRLKVSLDQALDLPADAATARTLGQALQRHPSASDWLQRCDELAVTLIHNPVEAGALATLLGQLDQLTKGLQTY